MTSENAEKKPDDGRSEAADHDGTGTRHGLPATTTPGSSLIVLQAARKNPLLSWLRQNGSTVALAGVAGAFAGGLVAMALGFGAGGNGAVIANAGGAGLGLDPGISYETTGSITSGQRGSAEGWVLWRVRDGRALVQGESGYFEVAPGSKLPGLGTVLRIERQDGHWIVETANGLILPESS